MQEEEGEGGRRRNGRNAFHSDPRLAGDLRGTPNDRGGRRGSVCESGDVGEGGEVVEVCRDNVTLSSPRS